VANLFFSKPTVAMTNSSGDGRAGEWALYFSNYQRRLSALSCRCSTRGEVANVAS
jgi:hypothetical protein